MSATEAVPVEVPDIGDFEEVPIIEILVSPGDQVAADDPLLTLESDKATMDVPAPFAGTIKELLVEVGDKVSQGTKLLEMETDDGGAPTGTDASAAASEGAPAEAGAPDAIGSAAEAEEQDAPEQARPPEREDAPEHERAPEREHASPSADENGGGPVYASPSVRRIARELKHRPDQGDRHRAQGADHQGGRREVLRGRRRG